MTVTSEGDRVFYGPKQIILTSDCNITCANNSRILVNGAPMGAFGLNGCAGLWKGTQAQYDAIGIKDPNVVYVVS